MNQFDPINLFLKNTKYQKDQIINCEPISLGFSNKSFCLTTFDQKKFQVRFGMNNDIISRKNEFAVLKIMQDKSYIYYDQTNGNSIRKWFSGYNPELKDIDETFLKKLIQLVEKLHHVDLNHVLIQDIIPQDNFCFIKKFEKKINTYVNRIYIDKYLELIQKYKNLSNCLSHNDLSLLNLIFNPKNYDLKLIDFEWSRLNNAYWDYANFIRESRLNFELSQRLAKLAKLDWLILRDHIYICTCFAVQWALSMPKDKNVYQYFLKTYDLLKDYFKTFYNSKNDKNNLIIK